MSKNSVQLMEKAPSGLHDFCEDLLSKHIDKSAKILDIASGTGAMSRRLIKSGYENIVANDIDSNSFEAKEVVFTSVNLNNDFSNNFQAHAFDVILAIEIIEHLENPSAFIRECSKTLKKNGLLLLTTPNVLGSESLMLLLKNRGLLYFSAEHYDNLGHISILPDWLLGKHVRKAGLEVVYQGYSPRLLTRDGSNNRIRQYFGTLLLKSLDLFSFCLGRSKAETVGTNFVMLLKKNREE